MRIDCERCPERQGEARCDGCLVDFVLELEGEGDDVVVADADLVRAVRVLADAGLLQPAPERRAG